MAQKNLISIVIYRFLFSVYWVSIFSCLFGNQSNDKQIFLKEESNRPALGTGSLANVRPATGPLLWLSIAMMDGAKIWVSPQLPHRTFKATFAISIAQPAGMWYASPWRKARRTHNLVPAGATPPPNRSPPGPTQADGKSHCWSPKGLHGQGVCRCYSPRTQTPPSQPS